MREIQQSAESAIRNPASSNLYAEVDRPHTLRFEQPNSAVLALPHLVIADNTGSSITQKSICRFDGKVLTPLQIADKYFSLSPVPKDELSRADGLLHRSDIERALKYFEEFGDTDSNSTKIRQDLKQVLDRWDTLPKDMHDLVRIDGPR